MKRRRHTPEQIVRKLREADRLLAEGQEAPEVAKQLEVSEATYHRWRAQYGGLKADDVRRLKAERVSHSEIARQLGIGRTEVRRILAAGLHRERVGLRPARSPVKDGVYRTDTPHREQRATRRVNE